MLLKSLKTCVLALCSASALLYGAGAQAAIVTTDLNDTNAPTLRNTGWRISYDNAQVQNVSFTGKTNGNNKGTLQIDKIFTNLGPISITFLEIDPAAANSFGLRITLNENVKNQSGTNWTDFHMMLVDTNPVVASPPASGAHPGYAHFHDDPIAAPPFTMTGGGDAESFVDFGNGTFANGDTRAWSGFGIHQFERTGTQRNFTLVEMASVPEPAFVGFALLGMLLMFRKRRT